MEKLKVLLCDDEATILDGLMKLFDWESHHLLPTIVCGDGIMAQNRAKELKPHIMLMDIDMPLMSGLEVIRSLSPILPDTIFIILSGYNEFSYAQEALKLRVSDYLLKPVRFDELSRVLNQARLSILHKTLLQKDHAASPEGEEPLLNRVVAYLNEHLADEITLNQLAEVFALNPTYISQFFKNKTGINYLKYISLLRMNQAKKLLVGTDMPICSIANAVGFDDYRVFTKAFKRAEGVTPSGYRKNE